MRRYLTQLLCAAALTLGLSPPLAWAQSADLTGTWRCEQGVAPLNNTNLPSVHVIFDIVLYPNGTMQAAGIANQINQFQAQGNWVLQNGRFSTQGQMTDALGVSQFGFSSLVTSATTMNERSFDQNNSYATACQKS